MTEFKRGQRVSVSYEATVRSDGVHQTTGRAHLVDDDGRSVFAHPKYVTQLDPANWPPQVGDIWELDGEEYYVKKSTNRNRDLYVVPSTGATGFYPDGPSGDSFKRSYPTLVRRRGDALLFRQADQ